MSDQQPTSLDGLDSGSVSELAGTGRSVWDSPAVGAHARVTGFGWSARPVSMDVPDRVRTLVPGDIFFV